MLLSSWLPSVFPAFCTLKNSFNACNCWSFTFCSPCALANCGTIIDTPTMILPSKKNAGINALFID